MRQEPPTDAIIVLVIFLILLILGPVYVMSDPHRPHHEAPTLKDK
jgi:hypothetical protein